jgi:hypothetical protein
VVHSGNEPLIFENCDLDAWQTATTGQVISPEKISQSGVNMQGKDEVSRSWDIHAERGLKCTDCHYSLQPGLLSGKQQSGAALTLIPPPG